jgi:hypothetical protein
MDPEQFSTRWDRFCARSSGNEMGPTMSTEATVGAMMISSSTQLENDGVY